MIWIFLLCLHVRLCENEWKMHEKLTVYYVIHVTAQNIVTKFQPQVQLLIHVGKHSTHSNQNSSTHFANSSKSCNDCSILGLVTPWQSLSFFKNFPCVAQLVMSELRFCPYQLLCTSDINKTDYFHQPEYFINYIDSWNSIWIHEVLCMRFDKLVIYNSM